MQDVAGNDSMDGSGVALIAVLVLATPAVARRTFLPYR